MSASCTCRPEDRVAGLAAASCPLHGIDAEWGPAHVIDSQALRDRALAEHTEAAASRAAVLEDLAKIAFVTAPVAVLALRASDLTSWGRGAAVLLPLLLCAGAVAWHAVRARLALAAAADRLLELAEREERQEAERFGSVPVYPGKPREGLGWRTWAAIVGVGTLAFVVELAAAGVL